MIEQKLIAGENVGRNTLAKTLNWSLGQVSKLTKELFEQTGLKGDWQANIEVLTSSTA
jgi:hypothetical protein